MKQNPKTTAEFWALPIGPEAGREISERLYPLIDGDILGLEVTETGVYWRVHQYVDGARFRHVSSRG
jgi:hypothetical protein